MNNVILKKILKKVSLKDLYDEIKNNDKAILALGTIILSKKKDLFVSWIKIFIETVIKSGDEDVEAFLKEEILNMDGDSISVNSVSKRKVASSAQPISTSIKADPDPCSRGGFGRTC